jgi:hypothetical protein
MDTDTQKQSSSHILTFGHSVLAILLLFVVGNIAFGWTDPSSDPPGGAGSLSTDGSGNVSILKSNNSAALGLTIKNTGTGGSNFLQIGGGASGDTNAPYLSILGSGSNQNVDPQIKLGGYSITQFILGIDVSENKFKISNDLGFNDFMSIDNTGNVGIGTTNPLSKLSVEGGVTLGGTPEQLHWNNRIPLQNKFTVVDGASTDVGKYNSLTIGADGLPVISYYDSTNLDLKVLKCGTLTCAPVSSNIITTVDSVGNVGTFNSIAIGGDRMPVIFYYDTSGGLKVLKCGTASCFPTTSNTISSLGTFGSAVNTAITIGTDGNPIVAFSDGDTKIIKCGNAFCSSENIPITMDSTNGGAPSISLNTQGFPAMIYSSTGLRLAECTDSACTGKNLKLLSSPIGGGIVGFAIPPDGLPVSATYEGGDLIIDKCTKANCSLDGKKTVDSGLAGALALSVGVDGLPVIAYDLNSPLAFVKCGDSSCGEGNTISSFESLGSGFKNISLAIGVDGLPIISYYHLTNGDLKVLHCGSDRCLNYWTRR